MKIEKLHQVAVLSRDLDETRTFYEDTLGARLLAYFEGPPSLLFFDFLGTRMLFERAAPRSTGIDPVGTTGQPVFNPLGLSRQAP